jgi:hypothetical protein
VIYSVTPGNCGIAFCLGHDRFLVLTVLLNKPHGVSSQEHDVLYDDAGSALNLRQ